MLSREIITLMAWYTRPN